MSENTLEFRSPAYVRQGASKLMLTGKTSTHYLYCSTSTPKLAQEIIELIADFLWDDPVQLSSCTLVCRAWYHAARHHLKLPTTTIRSRRHLINFAHVLHLRRADATAALYWAYPYKMIPQSRSLTPFLCASLDISCQACVCCQFSGWTGRCSDRIRASSGTYLITHQ